MQYAEAHQRVHRNIEVHRTRLDVYGLPQIDYVVSQETLSVKQINEQVILFQKTRLWKEKEWDQIKVLERYYWDEGEKMTPSGSD